MFLLYLLYHPIRRNICCPWDYPIYNLNDSEKKNIEQNESPNFDLHIRKTDVQACKKFTTIVKVLDNTIPSIMVYGGNVSLSHPKGQLVNAKHILYIMLNTKSPMASFSSRKASDFKLCIITAISNYIKQRKKKKYYKRG